MQKVFKKCENKKIKLIFILIQLSEMHRAERINIGIFTVILNGLMALKVPQILLTCLLLVHLSKPMIYVQYRYSLLLPFNVTMPIHKRLYFTYLFETKA